MPKCTRLLAILTSAALVGSALVPLAAAARPTGSPPWAGDVVIEAAAKCHGGRNVVQVDNITNSQRHDGEMYYITWRNPRFNTQNASGSFYCYDDVVAANWVRTDPNDNPPVEPRPSPPGAMDDQNAMQTACNSYYGANAPNAEVVRRDSFDSGSASPFYAPGQVVYASQVAFASVSGPYQCRGTLPAGAVDIVQLRDARRAARGGHTTFGSAGDAQSMARGDVSTAAGYCMRYYPGRSFDLAVVGIVRDGVYVTNNGRSAEYFKHGVTTYTCAAEVENWTNVDNTGGITYQPVVAKSQYQNAKDACPNGMVILVLDQASRDSQTLYNQQVTVFVREPSNGQAEPGWEDPPRSGNYACVSAGFRQTVAAGNSPTIFRIGSTAYADFGELQAQKDAQVVAARAAEAARQAAAAAAAAEAARQAAAAEAARQAAAAEAARQAAAAAEAARAAAAAAAVPKKAIVQCASTANALQVNSVFTGAVSLETANTIYFCNAKDLSYKSDNAGHVIGLQVASIGVFPLVASGGGNLVASGGGNLVASGGGNLVASGGGNLVASGGGNIAITDPSGSPLVAAGAGNLVASGGGNLVASGGGNLVASGGGNLVASGGGNLLSSLAGLVASGGGNFIRNGLLASPDAIARLVAQGGGNIIAQSGSGLIGQDGGGLLAGGTSGLINNSGGSMLQDRALAAALAGGSSLSSLNAGTAVSGGGGFTQSSGVTAFSNDSGRATQLYKPEDALAALTACDHSTSALMIGRNTVFAFPGSRQYMRLPETNNPNQLSAVIAQIASMTKPPASFMYGCRSDLASSGWTQISGSSFPPQPSTATAVKPPPSAPQAAACDFANGAAAGVIVATRKAGAPCKWLIANIANVSRDADGRSATITFKNGAPQRYALADIVSVQAVTSSGTLGPYSGGEGLSGAWDIVSRYAAATSTVPPVQSPANPAHPVANVASVSQPCSTQPAAPSMSGTWNWKTRESSGQWRVTGVSGTSFSGGFAGTGTAGVGTIEHGELFANPSSPSCWSVRFVRVLPASPVAPGGSQTWTGNLRKDGNVWRIEGTRVGLLGTRPFEAEKQ